MEELQQIDRCQFFCDGQRVFDAAKLLIMNASQNYGLEGEEVTVVKPIDIMILDLQMPKMNGIQIISSL